VERNFYSHFHISLLIFVKFFIDDLNEMPSEDFVLREDLPYLPKAEIKFCLYFYAFVGFERNSVNERSEKPISSDCMAVKVGAVTASNYCPG